MSGTTAAHFNYRRDTLVRRSRHGPDVNLKVRRDRRDVDDRQRVRLDGNLKYHETAERKGRNSLSSARPSTHGTFERAFALEPFDMPSWLVLRLIYPRTSQSPGHQDKRVCPGTRSGHNRQIPGL